MRVHNFYIKGSVRITSISFQKFSANSRISKINIFLSTNSECSGFAFLVSRVWKAFSKSIFVIWGQHVIENDIICQYLDFFKYVIADVIDSKKCHPHRSKRTSSWKLYSIFLLIPMSNGKMIQFCDVIWRWWLDSRCLEFNREYEFNLFSTHPTY